MHVKLELTYGNTNTIHHSMCVYLFIDYPLDGYTHIRVELARPYEHHK
jgi:hypothetical protein